MSKPNLSDPAVRKSWGLLAAVLLLVATVDGLLAWQLSKSILYLPIPALVGVALLLAWKLRRSEVEVAVTEE